MSEGQQCVCTATARWALKGMGPTRRADTPGLVALAGRGSCIGEWGKQWCTTARGAINGKRRVCDERSGRPTSRDVSRHGQAGRPRPPHPIDASYRIVSVAYWTRTSHRRTPVSRVGAPPASSPAAHRAHAGRRRAHTPGQRQRIRIKKSAPAPGTHRRTPFTAPIRSRPAGGRRGAPCGKNTRTRGHRAIHATSWRLPTSSGRMHRHEGATRRRPARRRHKNYSKE